MPIELLEGFEDYPGLSTAGVGLTSHWNLSTTNANSLEAGRVGGQAWNMGTSTAQNAWRPLANHSQQISFFIAFYLSNATWQSSTDMQFIGLAYDTNNHFSIGMNEARDLVIWDATGTVIARIPDKVHLRTWYSLAGTWKSGTSDGELKVWLNGESVATVLNSNFRNTNANANRIYLRRNTNNGVQVDDLRIDYDTLVQIPEGRYAIVEYDADDAVQFTPLSGPSNYLMIDDPTCDQDTTYNVSNTVGHRDVFTVKELPFNPDQIMAVQLTLIARKEDVATRRIKSFLISDTEEVDGDDLYLSTNYTFVKQILTVDPATGVAFTKGGLALVKPGYELVE